MDYFLHNGELTNRDSIRIDMEDRGYQFGDGIYEVIRVYNGKYFAWKEHFDRLYSSAEKISLTIGYSQIQLKHILDQLIEKNKVHTGSVYFQLTRGVAPRNHAFPGNEVQAVLTGNTKSYSRPVQSMEDGVSAIIVDDIRWLRCDIKSLNLLGNVMARQKALEADCFEAILHRDGVVTEGSHTNVAIVKNGIVHTHPANNLILNGISRQVMLNLCREIGINSKEEPFSVEELLSADEVFLTGTTIEITPVIQINKQQIGEGIPGTITNKLQEQFLRVIEHECGKV